MKKVERVEEYIRSFFSTRFEEYKDFYNDVSRGKRNGVYLLKKGGEIMDLLNDITSNIEEKLISPRLVPEKFASPESLISFLILFKEHMIGKRHLLDINHDGENTSYIIRDLANNIDEMVDMIERAILLFDSEDSIVPYQELRYSLIKNDLDTFISIMKSILASVSYAITKKSEGFLHSNIHVILKLLGFDIVSEETTNIGRIDAVIRFSERIFIFEFKLGDALTALDQIKSKKYHEKFIIEKKQIVFVGVSFDSEVRNIADFCSELYNPLT